MAAVVDALKAMKSSDKKDGEVVRLKGIPFRLSPRKPAGILLDDKKGEAKVAAAESCAAAYLLFAVLEMGKGDEVASCRISREDGMAIRLKWTKGVNIGPSVGHWKNNLKPAEERPGTTKVIWEGRAKKNVPVRLFYTTWVNDNEWYPVRRLDWKLTGKSARLVLLAVTFGNYKD